MALLAGVAKVVSFAVFINPFDGLSVAVYTVLVICAVVFPTKIELHFSSSQVIHDVPIIPRALTRCETKTKGLFP